MTTEQEEAGCKPGAETNGPLLEEWKRLRDEILQRQASDERIVLATIMSSGAIYAFAMQSPGSLSVFACEIPVVLVTVMYLWLMRNSRNGRRIARYLRKIEPIMGMGWEDWVDKERRSEGQKDVDVFSCIYWLLWVLSPALVSLMVSTNATICNPSSLGWLLVSCVVGTNVVSVVVYRFGWAMGKQTRAQDRLQAEKTSGST